METVEYYINVNLEGQRWVVFLLLSIICSYHILILSFDQRTDYRKKIRTHPRFNFKQVYRSKISCPCLLIPADLFRWTLGDIMVKPLYEMRNKGTICGAMRVALIKGYSRVQTSICADVPDCAMSVPSMG